MLCPSIKSNVTIASSRSEMGNKSAFRIEASASSHSEGVLRDEERSEKLAVDSVASSPLMSQLSIVILFLVTFITSEVSCSPTYQAAGCEVGWVRWRDKCFLLHPDPGRVNFYNAITLCSHLHRGATLASIRSREEQDFLTAYVFGQMHPDLNDYYRVTGRNPSWPSATGERRSVHFRKSAVGFVWIGAIRQNNNSFKWLDGSEWRYTNWDEFEPSYADESTYCVVMDNRTEIAGKWQDHHCVNLFHPLCQQYTAEATNRLEPFNPPPQPPSNSDFIPVGRPNRPTESDADGFSNPKNTDENLSSETIHGKVTTTASGNNAPPYSITNRKDSEPLNGYHGQEEENGGQSLVSSRLIGLLVVGAIFANHMIVHFSS